MRQLIESIITMEAGQLFAHAALIALLGVGAVVFVQGLQFLLDFYNSLEDCLQQNHDGEK